MVIPNAIAVTTHRKEYLFRSFWDRDECFRLLQELISRYRYNDNSSQVSESKVEAVPGGAITHTPSFDAHREVTVNDSTSRASRPLTTTRSLTPVKSPQAPQIISKTSNGASSGSPVLSTGNTTMDDGTRSPVEVRGTRSGSTEEESDIETSTCEPISQPRC
jgi:hypothetical protein